MTFEYKGPALRSRLNPTSCRYSLDGGRTAKKLGALTCTFMRWQQPPCSFDARLIFCRELLESQLTSYNTPLDAVRIFYGTP